MTRRWTVRRGHATGISRLPLWEVWSPEGYLAERTVDWPYAVRAADQWAREATS